MIKTTKYPHKLIYSPTFNRAAAQTGKEAYDRALTDCRKALEIDPDYSKAYSRMG